MSLHERVPPFYDIIFSRCYRDPEVSDALRDTVLPTIAKMHPTEATAPLRARSVGAASGAEAYPLRIL